MLRMLHRIEPLGSDDEALRRVSRERIEKRKAQRESTDSSVAGADSSGARLRSAVGAGTTSTGRGALRSTRATGEFIDTW